MLVVAPRRLALLLLLASACFHDDRPALASTGDPGTSGSGTGSAAPTTGTSSSTSTGDDGTSTSSTTGDGTSTGDTGCVATAWYLDDDEDGHGDPKTLQTACARPAGFVGIGDDCDDGDAARAPDQPELCDSKDNDCDLLVDEYSPSNPTCGDCTLFALADHSYAFCPLPVAWTDARGECMKRGGDLVVIDDGSENAALAAQGAATPGTTGTWSIGINDTVTEGSFVWLDGGAVGFTAWGAGEPNNLEEEDCGALIDTGLWNDQSCALATNFICEVAPP